MAIAKHGNEQKWYVYEFVVRRTPFYVGIGHHQFGVGRAEDRLRWVCSQIKRELDDKPVKWVLHSEVIKWLILTPESIKCRYVRKTLSRADALSLERQRIKALEKKGVLLANVHHCARPRPLAKEIVSYLRRRPA